RSDRVQNRRVRSCRDREPTRTAPGPVRGPVAGRRAGACSAPAAAGADPATAVVRTRLDAAANSSLTPLDLGDREQCCCILPGHGSRQTLIPSLQNTGPLCTHSCPPRPPDAPFRALRMPVCDPYHVRPAVATPTSPADRRKLRCSAQAGGYTVQLEFSI